MKTFFWWNHTRRERKGKNETQWTIKRATRVLQWNGSASADANKQYNKINACKRNPQGWPKHESVMLIKGPMGSGEMWKSEACKWTCSLSFHGWLHLINRFALFAECLATEKFNASTPLFPLETYRENGQTSRGQSRPTHTNL